MQKEVINIRIDSDFKTELGLLCDLRGMSLSDFGRNALQQYFNSILDEACEVGATQENDCKNPDDDLLNSLAFSEFVFWIYHKKTKPFMDDPVYLYRRHLELINKMHHHPSFFKQILDEFEKIRIELEQRVNDQKSDFHQFQFVESNHSGSFNYGTFADFMYYVRALNQDDEFCENGNYIMI
jgi:hypothetical protein